MSAWYVWASLGLYPLAPGAGQLAITLPRFDRITVHPRGGTPLTLTRGGRGNHLTYRLNSYSSNASHFVSYSGLKEGKSLHVEAHAAAPTPADATHHRTIAMKPWSDRRFVAVPSLDAPRTYRGRSAEVVVSHLDPTALLELRLEGSDRWKRIAPGAHRLKHSGTFYVRASLPEAPPAEISHTMYRMEHATVASYPVARYDHQYTAGGDQALVDGLFGSTEFRTGEWQGFPGKPLTVVLDCGRVEALKGIRLGALQDTRPWIFLPREVRVETSVDGIAWNVAGAAGHEVPETQEGAHVHRFEVPFTAKARYLRIVAEPYGPLPVWHLSAGEPAWLFVDEIELLR